MRVYYETARQHAPVKIGVHASYYSIFRTCFSLRSVGQLFGVWYILTQRSLVEASRSDACFGRPLLQSGQCSNTYITRLLCSRSLLLGHQKWNTYDLLSFPATIDPYTSWILYCGRNLGTFGTTSPFIPLAGGAWGQTTRVQEQPQQTQIAKITEFETLGYMCTRSGIYMGNFYFKEPQLQKQVTLQCLVSTSIPTTCLTLFMCFSCRDTFSMFGKGFAPWVLLQSKL